MVLVVWLVVVWNELRYSEQFGAYATFGTALATLALAVATAIMASLNRKQIRQNTVLIEQNRQLVEQSRIAVWRPYYVDLIACVLEPLLQATKGLVAIHRNKSYSWEFKHEEELEGHLPNEVDVELFRLSGPKPFYLPTVSFSLKSFAAGLNERRYSDLLQEHDRLTNSISEYENQVGELARLLLSLAGKMLSGDFNMKKRVQKHIPPNIVKGQPEYEEGIQKNTLHCVKELLNIFLGCPERYGITDVKEFLVKHEDSLMEELAANEGMAREGERARSLADSMAGNLEDIADYLKGLSEKYRRDFAITEEMIAMAREASR